jgi:hypothetical protein
VQYNIHTYSIAKKEEVKDVRTRTHVGHQFTPISMCSINHVHLTSWAYLHYLHWTSTDLKGDSLMEPRPISRNQPTQLGESQKEFILIVPSKIVQNKFSELYLKYLKRLMSSFCDSHFWVSSSKWVPWSLNFQVSRSFYVADRWWT